ncbi:unnamed protein product [Moneuplotes crassus]|uniref:Uncharacterized protein n=1 Tax=Euplotes crassus TaxID=5936 RepID=A0AAD2D8G4_EUPCR|nr:unnamed protein product [Moneuplotes crassus]
MNRFFRKKYFYKKQAMVGFEPELKPEIHSFSFKWNPNKMP